MHTVGSLLEGWPREHNVDITDQLWPVKVLVKIIFSDGGRIADVHRGSDQLPLTENGKYVIVKWCKVLAKVIFSDDGRIADVMVVVATSDQLPLTKNVK